MRWGTPDIDDRWHRSFAWLPKKCLDGTWVWLEPVERISYFAREIPGLAHHSFLRDWCYRPIGTEAE